MEATDSFESMMMKYWLGLAGHHAIASGTRERFLFLRYVVSARPRARGVDTHTRYTHARTRVTVLIIGQQCRVLRRHEPRYRDVPVRGTASCSSRCRGERRRRRREVAQHVFGHVAQPLRVETLRERVEGEVESLAPLHVLQQPRHLAELREGEAAVRRQARRKRRKVRVAVALDLGKVEVEPA